MVSFGKRPSPSIEPPEPVSGRFELVDSDVGPVWLRADDDVIRPAVRQSGTWEADEGALILQLMEGRTAFLDIGANIGWFSMLVASRLPSATVDAVEPSPDSLGALRLNCWPFGDRVRVWPVALSDERSVVALAETEHNPGDARLQRGSAVATILVATIAGDDLFAGRAFDVVKIDVQGYELDVLLGLRRTLDRSPGVRCVVEFQPSGIVAAGQRPSDVLDGYRQLGLSIVAQVAGRLTPLEDFEIIATCERAGTDGYLNLVLGRAAS